MPTLKWRRRTTKSKTPCTFRSIRQSESASSVFQTTRRRRMWLWNGEEARLVLFWPPRDTTLSGLSWTVRFSPQIGGNGEQADRVCWSVRVSHSSSVASRNSWHVFLVFVAIVNRCVRRLSWGGWWQDSARRLHPVRRARWYQHTARLWNR